MAGHSARRILLILATCFVYAMMMAVVVLNRVYGRELGIFKNTTGEQGLKYRIMITPPSEVFFIWFLIYAFEAAFVLYGLSSLCRKTSTGSSIYRLSLTPPIVYILFIVNNLAIILWMFLWDREYTVAAMIIISVIPFTLYICLFYSFRGLTNNLTELYHQDCHREPWLVRILVHNGLSLYAGWATVATLLNLGIVIVFEAKVEMEIISVAILGALIFVLLLWFWLDVFCFDIFTRYTFLMYVPPLAAAGGLVAKLIMQQPLKELEWNRYNIVLITTAGLCLICLIIKIAVLIYRHRKHPIYKRTLISIEKGEEENQDVTTVGSTLKVESEQDQIRYSHDTAVVSPVAATGVESHGFKSEEKNEQGNNEGEKRIDPVGQDDTNTPKVLCASNESGAEAADIVIESTLPQDPPQGKAPQQMENPISIDNATTPTAIPEERNEQIVQETKNDSESPPEDSNETNNHNEEQEQSNKPLKEDDIIQDTLTTSAVVEADQRKETVGPHDVRPENHLVALSPREELPDMTTSQVSDQDDKHLISQDECDPFTLGNPEVKVGVDYKGNDDVRDDEMETQPVVPSTQTTGLAEEAALIDLKETENEPHTEQNDDVPPVYPVDVNAVPPPNDVEEEETYYERVNEDDDDPRNYPQEFTGNGEMAEESDAMADNSYLPPPPPTDYNQDSMHQEEQMHHGMQNPYDNELYAPEDDVIGEPITSGEPDMENMVPPMLHSYNAENDHCDENSDSSPYEGQNGIMQNNYENEFDNMQHPVDLKSENLARTYDDDDSGVTSAV